jgi:hypothetical protein
LQSAPPPTAIRSKPRSPVTACSTY